MVARPAHLRRLLAVDLPNVVARCWHAGEAIRLPDGRAIHGVTGAVATIVRSLRADNFDDLLIAVDGPASRRREIDAGYKASRRPSDPDMRRQLWECVELLGACGWPVIVWGGLEADDVLASAARCYPGTVTVLSGDKDLLATCTDRVTLQLLRGQGPDLLCGPEQCREMLGVLPNQVSDLKALAGDASDCIPGIPGVGPRTARVILERDGSLARAYQRLEASGAHSRTDRTLIAHRADAQRSWRLGHLVSDLPLDDSWRSLDGCFGPAAAEAARTRGYTEVARRVSWRPQHQR